MLYWRLVLRQHEGELRCLSLLSSLLSKFTLHATSVPFWRRHVRDCQTTSQHKTCSNPRVISVVRRVSQTRASHPLLHWHIHSSELILSSYRCNLKLTFQMATTNAPSTGRTWSDDSVLSNATNVLQSNGRATDEESHRAVNGTGLEHESPYSSSTRRGYGSAVELRGYAAGATSAANSGQPQRVTGSHPASSRPVAPQTTASRSFRPAANADAEQDALYRSDLVCAPRLSLRLGTLTSAAAPQRCRWTT